MKNIKLFYAIIAATALFAACDPGYSEDVVIHNGSTHTVTVVPSPSVEHDNINDTTIVYEQKSFTIAPNESVTVQSIGGVGTASRSEGEMMMHYYLNDSVVFVFDDNRRIVYYEENIDGISPYNFGSSNYSYEEKLNESGPFKNCANYGKLTYTVSDEHYEAAGSGAK